MSDYRIFWGDTHDNTYTQDPPEDEVNEVYQRARSHLDFYGMAYYTARLAPFTPPRPAPNGSTPRICLEEWKDDARLDREYAEVKAAANAIDEPGRFIAFAGYEWQGNGVSGDHNVFSLHNDHPIHRVQTISELYECLRGHDVIAIPHHIAYRPGQRGRDWAVWDERLSPFCEIYSVHGCSETDEEVNYLRLNRHMGPSHGGTSYQDALNRGYRIGCIGSTDNWGRMPGCYGDGLMGCLATGLTREALWDAFLARRVYGVTGDRIGLDYTVNGADMGSVISANGPRRIHAAVEGLDAIDRIELLRGDRVIATHCHQGTWDLPVPGRRTRWKIRLEVGWGPGPRELLVPPRHWQLEATLGAGRIVGCTPCWNDRGQGQPVIDGDRLTAAMLSDQSTVTQRWQSGLVLELDAAIDDTLTVTINGLTASGTIADFAAHSRVLWYKPECEAVIEEYTGVTQASQEREDVFYHLAYKAKIHRAIPAAGYTATLDFEDDTPFTGEIHYRVRAEQRNGQRLWSSPIWVA